MAEAQLGLGGSGGLGGLIGGLVGGLGGLVGGLVGGILNLVNINGVVFCSLNGAPSGTSTPAFASKLSILLLSPLINHAKPAQQKLLRFC